MDNHPLPRRHNRRPRLDPSVYAASGYAIHVILGTYRRRPIFQPHAPVAATVLGTLTNLAGESGVTLYAYCLMPDHLHFVAAVQPGGRNMFEFMRLFRQRLDHATRQ